eukprot:10706834-Karenia_brevis.AAC.1
MCIAGSIFPDPTTERYTLRIDEGKRRWPWNASDRVVQTKRLKNGKDIGIASAVELLLLPREEYETS